MSAKVSAPDKTALWVAVIDGDKKDEWKPFEHLKCDRTIEEILEDANETLTPIAVPKKRLRRFQVHIVPFYELYEQDDYSRVVGAIVDGVVKDGHPRSNWDYVKSCVDDLCVKIRSTTDRIPYADEIGYRLWVVTHNIDDEDVSQFVDEILTIVKAQLELDWNLITPDFLTREDLIKDAMDQYVGHVYRAVRRLSGN